MEPAAAAGPRAGHHDLCFGCGLANVFGLALEASREPGGRVGGRFFVKQDHQGADGAAHPGVLAAALSEAMSLALDAPLAWFEVEVLAAAPVGTMVEVAARADGGRATAAARGEDGLVARASAASARR
jgi:hypothetical protein